MALLVVLAAVAAAGVGASAAGSGEVVDVDTDWQLTSNQSVHSYQSSGVAHTEGVAGHAFAVTIAEDSSDVPLDGWHVDSQATYFHVSYSEEIPRTYRLYVPADYWGPRVKEGLPAEDSPVTIDLRPTESNDYTVLTITFDGPTNATFKLGKSAGYVFGGREYVSDKVNNTTGISLPSFGESSAEGSWQYIERARLSGENTTVAIQTGGGGVMVQYDTSRAHKESRWVSVPKCSRETRPVCVYRKDGVNDTVYIMSPASDPPQVRYKHGTDAKSGLFGGFNKIRDAVNKFMDDIGGLFGGG